MDERIKSAFDGVRADDAIKRKTRAALAQRRRRGMQLRPLLAMAACMLVLITGGYDLMLTPTAEISIDINPSVELSLNRLDQVIDVRGMNEDGRALAETLNLRFVPYEKAMATILGSDVMTALLEGDAYLSVGVIGEGEKQRSRVLGGVEAQTNAHKNAHCFAAQYQELEDAHALGLSCGKYRAYQTLKSLNAGVEAGALQEMTMREVQQLIESLGGGEMQHGRHDGGVQHSGSGRHGEGRRP